MGKRMTVKIGNLGREIGRLLDETAKVNRQRVDAILDDAPRQMENEALGFYPSVLGVVTGDLRREIAGFRRGSSDGNLGGAAGTITELGLRDEMEYAAIHEFGGRAGRGGSVHITAKRWLSTPLRVYSWRLKEELARGIKWP